MASLYYKYNQLLVKRPFVTNSVSTAFLFGAGDFLAQKIADKDTSYDLARTLRAVIYGGIIFAPLGDRWYKILPRVKMPFLAHKSPRPVANTIARVGLDQLVFAPFLGIPLYYTAMTLMELPSDPRLVIALKLKENWWSTLRTNWYVWPAVQMLNFGFVPVQLRLLVVNVVSIGWNCYLLMVLNDNNDHLIEVKEDQVF